MRGFQASDLVRRLELEREQILGLLEEFRGCSLVSDRLDLSSLQQLVGRPDYMSASLLARSLGVGLFLLDHSRRFQGVIARVH